MAEAAVPRRIVEMLAQARRMEIVFIVLTLALLWYTFFNVFSWLWERDWQFDSMLITGGAAFLVIAWRADRIGDRLTRVLRELDAAGAVLMTTDEREAVERTIDQRGHRYGMITSVVVVVVLLVGLLLNQDALIGPYVTVLLGLLLTGCGGYAGYRFGQLIANGQLLSVLAAAGKDIRGGVDLGIRALAPLRDLYGIALLVGIALCAYFNVWWAGWAAGIPAFTQYDHWQPLFLALWVVSIFVLLFAYLVPVRRFKRRLNEIYGDSDVRRLTFPRQRELALADIKWLDGRIAQVRDGPVDRREELARLVRKRDELDQYAQRLTDRARNDWLMEPATVVAFASASTVGMAVSVAIAGIPGI